MLVGVGIGTCLWFMICVNDLFWVFFAIAFVVFSGVMLVCCDLYEFVYVYLDCFEICLPGFRFVVRYVVLSLWEL